MKSMDKINLDNYDVAVIFRRSSAYCRNVSGDSITGLIKIDCKRCDLEALLSEFIIAKNGYFQGYTRTLLRGGVNK